MPSDTEAIPGGLPDFPPPHFPTVFADGVSALVNSPSIVKFFFSRFEPSFTGDGRSKLQPFAQVIMPMDSFATMCVFFEAQLRSMVQGGFIAEERLAQMRDTFQGTSSK